MERRPNKEVVGECVDQLVTMEIRRGNCHIRGVIRPFYDSAFRKLGGRPLTLLAAEKLIENVKPGENVLIVTGFASPAMPHGETDGPLGAASVARALSFALDAKPIFVLGDRDIEPTKATVKAAGLRVEEYEIAKEIKNAAAFIPFPLGDGAEGKAREIIEQYKPKSLITVEAPGPNRKGVMHGMSGRALERTKLHLLFTEAEKQGILTIGCIDGGNEIGSGVIEEEVRKLTPHGDVCQCPCQSGMACAIATDIVIPANISNWGAYGISAMLAFLLKEPDLIQDPDTERRMLEASIMAGGIDGNSVSAIMSVDGISGKTQQYLVGILREVVEKGLME